MIDLWVAIMQKQQVSIRNCMSTAGTDAKIDGAAFVEASRKIDQAARTDTGAVDTRTDAASKLINDNDDNKSDKPIDESEETQNRARVVDMRVDDVVAKGSNDMSCRKPSDVDDESESTEQTEEKPVAQVSKEFAKNVSTNVMNEMMNVLPNPLTRAGLIFPPQPLN